MFYLCLDNKCVPKVASSGRFVAVTPNLHPKRNLKDAVLLFGYKGECAIAQDGREYILKKGDCMLLFPEHTHYGTQYSTVGQSHFWCHFYLPQDFCVKEIYDILKFKNSDLCILPEFAHIKDYEKIFILFSQLIDSMEAEIRNNNVIESFLKIILCSISDSVCAEKVKDKPIVSQKIREIIHFKEFDNITVESVAKELNYNPNYLSRVIKSETGLTTVEYINSLRIKHAKSLLINSNMRICEISQKCGISDQKYFLKLFKKYEGITAGQYRTAYFRKNIN